MTVLGSAIILMLMDSSYSFFWFTDQVCTDLSLYKNVYIPLLYTFLFLQPLRQGFSKVLRHKTFKLFFVFIAVHVFSVAKTALRFL